MNKKEELFKAPRWRRYQPVEVLNITVKPTEEDKKKVKEFRKFIDEKERTSFSTNIERDEYRC